MSSTAIVLPMLAERDLLQTRAGRDGFAVLLFQDLAFIPLVALVPLLAGHAVPDHVPWRDVGRAVAAIVVILAGGRFLMRPLFRAIGGARTPEVFTTAALLIVTGTALLASAAGLSPSLGAFMAGVLLSESEYRHELEADIAPFEGLLLGFFFISVGMSADLALARTAPVLLVGGDRRIAGCQGRRSSSCWHAWRGRTEPTRCASPWRCRRPASSASCCSRAAVAAGRVGVRPRRGWRRWWPRLRCWRRRSCSPASEALAIPRLRPRKEPEYDTIDGRGDPVIIAGFGRVGQIVGRVLRLHGIAFTALERDPGQVEVVRRFGNKVYFGDPARADVLRAAGAERRSCWWCCWMTWRRCCAWWTSRGAIFPS